MSHHRSAQKALLIIQGDPAGLHVLAIPPEHTVLEFLQDLLGRRHIEWRFRSNHAAVV